MSVSLPQSKQPDGPLNVGNGHIGVLLVGHGTRSLAGQTEFRQLCRQVAELLQPVVSDFGFLELADPDIATALERLAAGGISQVLVVPVILFTAEHAESDIPNAVQAAIQTLKITCVGQTPALECSDELLQLSAERFRQAACAAKCRLGCCGQLCSSATWLMVGRGSSSESATRKAREFFDLRHQLTPTNSAHIAFIHGQEPTVDQAMDACATDQSNIVVVQPHLLFSGTLLDQLRQQVRWRQQQNPHQRWIITDTLGADHKLAELLAERARAMLRTVAV